MREREGGKKSQNKIKVGNYETKSGVIREMIRFFFIKSFFSHPASADTQEVVYIPWGECEYLCWIGEWLGLL